MSAEAKHAVDPEDEMDEEMRLEGKVSSGAASPSGIHVLIQVR